MNKILSAADAENVTKDSRRSNQFIEQFNKQVLESAKDGFYCASVYIRFSDDIEDLDYLYKDIQEDDPEIIAVKEAGYNIHIVHSEHGFHKLEVSWGSNVVWNEKEGWARQ